MFFIHTDVDNLEMSTGCCGYCGYVDKFTRVNPYSMMNGTG